MFNYLPQNALRKSMTATGQESHPRQRCTNFSAQAIANLPDRPSPPVPLRLRLRVLSITQITRQAVEPVLGVLGSRLRGHRG